MSVISDQQNNCDVHLHAEIEVLKQALVEKQNQLIAMETACLRESDRQVELEDSIIAWQDKYDRLYESHKRVQKVNQSLEDKLLKLVDRNSGERAQLTSDVATLSVRLAQANYNIAKLQREIERYKTDINLAIQLLQCKPDSFVPQKVSSLPMEIQSKVSSYMRLETNSHSDSEGSTSGVGVATSGSYKVLPVSDSPPPMCPFPPTAMVYSMRGLDAQNPECSENSEQMISPSIMAKYLEDELKASEIKHCDTCNCAIKDLTVLAEEPKTYSIGTQTVVQGNANNSLCLRCNSNLNSPSRTNSPYIMKLVKSSDSVISETKSSVSDLNDNEKLFTPAKKDDLMVNPILSHHRLCDRTINKQHVDTAKYIFDNRKLENELNEMRKFNEKSPISSLPTDINHSQNVHATNDKKHLDTHLPGSTNKGVLETEIEAMENNLMKNKFYSKSDLSVSDKKTEAKLLESTSSGASGYASAEKENSRAAFTGSTNSLWSKTSSSEGAKLFENFNRNLIKTIKAENPKHRGPRLCALRIQNGSNNILLDNIESDVTPVVYTRRQRFLDEELDDTKDIITSKTSAGSAVDKKSNLSSSTENHTTQNATEFKDTSNKTDTEKYCDAVHSKDVINNNVSMAVEGGQENDILNKMSIQNIDRIDLNNVNGEIVLANGIMPCGQLQTSACADPLNSNAFLSVDAVALQHHHHQQQLHSYDNLNTCNNSNTSSFKNTASKSCTQSSSVSSNCADVDLQESALLRRQQLNRVAEWVQNNSQMEQAKMTMALKNNVLNNNVDGTSSDINAKASSNCHPEDVCDSDHSPNNNTCSRTADLNNIPSPISQNSCSSVERLSMDSGYKTKKQIQNGFYNAINNNIPPATKTTLLTSMQLYKHSQQFTDDSKLINNYHHNCVDNSDFLAQNSYRKYYVDENNKIISVQHQLQSHSNAIGPQLHHQQVDLAQMEYNVKQFLLKQNEWSIANNGNNKSTTSSSISCGKKSTVVSNCNSSLCNDSMISIQSHPHRTETNL